MVYVKSWTGSRKYLYDSSSMDFGDRNSSNTHFGNKQDAENKIMRYHEWKHRQGITFFDVIVNDPMTKGADRMIFIEQKTI